MSPWERLLELPQSGGHFVQLYEADETALTRNVGHYLWEGLWRGEGVLVVTTPEHRQLFCEYLGHLGADIPALIQNHQVGFWDAQQTLVSSWSLGTPDWQRFEKVARAAMRQVRPGKGRKDYALMGKW